MKNTIDVCGVSCEILEDSVEQGIFWRDGALTPLSPSYKLVIRPDTGDIILTYDGRDEDEDCTGPVPFMSLESEINEEHLSSMKSLGDKLKSGKA